QADDNTITIEQNPVRFTTKAAPSRPGRDVVSEALSSERRFWTRSRGGPEAMTNKIVGKLHSEGVIAPNELYANMNQESSPWSWDAQDSKGNFIKDKKMAVQEIQLCNLNPHI
ncbi:hypothetical protein PSHT_05762, partial [Puccinia striiformis]